MTFLTLKRFTDFVPPMFRLPLYMWPFSPSGENTWAPVLTSAISHPSLHFTIIVNPDSGPGDWLNGEYAQAIAQLDALPNVRTVGYVDTAQVNKPDGPHSIERIGADIATYAERAEEVKLAGVFLDDVSNVWSEEVDVLLEEAVNRTKGTAGFHDARMVRCLVVLPHTYPLTRRQTIINPGTRPNFVTPNVDVSMSFEGSWDNYQDPESRDWLAGNPYDREHTAYIIFGAPADEVGCITAEAKTNASYVYVTDVLDDPYKSFGESWEAFVDAMAAE